MKRLSNQSNPEISALTPEEKEKIERMNRIRQSLSNAEDPAKQNRSDLPKPIHKSTPAAQALDISVEDNPPPVLGSEETRSQKVAQIREALAMVERPAAPAAPAKNPPKGKLPPLKKKGTKSEAARRAAAETVVAPPPQRVMASGTAPKTQNKKPASPAKQAAAPAAAKPLGKLPPLRNANAPAAQKPAAGTAVKPAQNRQSLPPLKKSGTAGTIAPAKGEAAVPLKPAKPKTAPQKTEKPKASAAPKAEVKANRESFSVGKIAAILGGSAAGALVIAYAVVAIVFAGKYLPNTYINDIPVGNMSKTEAAAELLSHARVDDLVLVTPEDEKVTFKASDFGANYSLEEEAIAPFAENCLTWPVKLFKESRYTVEYDFNYSAEELRNLVIDYDWGNEPAQNAFIQKTADGIYEIVPATVGDRFDKNRLMDHVVEYLTVGKSLIRMQESGCYDPFAADVQAEDLEEQLALCNRFASCSITFDYHDRQEVLEGATIADWVYFTDSGEIAFNRAGVEAFVAGMAEKYDTRGKDHKFRSTLDGMITVPYTSTSLYGWQMNQEATTDQIIELLHAGESATVEPVYEDWGIGYCRDEATNDIGNTYIEVDISAQHVWYYKGGVLQMETDCVTGVEGNPERRTPRGVFELWSREKNRVLGQMDDEGYETPVNYWMPINYTGVGLHDATWQSSFGGTRYMTGSGSHGCINLPLQFAKDLYNSVETGIPVIVHD